ERLGVNEEQGTRGALLTGTALGPYLEAALAALVAPDVVPPPAVLCDVEPVPLELDVPAPVEPGVVLTEPEMLVDELVPGVVDVLEDVLPGVVVVAGGVPVPLLDVLLLVLPPGVVLPAVPPLGVVLEEVLLESRVVVVTSSRFVQA